MGSAVWLVDGGCVFFPETCRVGDQQVAKPYIPKTNMMISGQIALSSPQMDPNGGIVSQTLYFREI